MEDGKEGEKKECPAVYRLKFEKDTGKYLGIISFNEAHQGHEFKLKKAELSSLMIEEIKNFNKGSSVVQIKDFLEQKFKVDLSYRAVYVEFRKIFPLFGPDDATIFMKWCDENSFIVKKHIDETNKFYTKLFISSPLMKNHYNSERYSYIRCNLESK